MKITEDTSANDRDDLPHDQIRQKEAIIKAEDFVFNQVWYGRHKHLVNQIEAGEIIVTESVSAETHRTNQKGTCCRNILEAALKAAVEVEDKCGMENLGPWTDFEWGMINGKLSALRWVLGDEWDNLDS